MPPYQTGHQSRRDTHLTIPLLSNEDRNLAKAAFITATGIAVIVGAMNWALNTSQNNTPMTAQNHQASPLILEASFFGARNPVMIVETETPTCPATETASEVCWAPAAAAP